MVRTPTEFSIRVNGQVLDRTSLVGPGRQVDSSAVTFDLTLGNHPFNDSLAFEGTIAEIVYVRAASSADAAEAERYLRDKYVGVLVN